MQDDKMADLQLGVVSDVDNVIYKWTRGLMTNN